MSLPGTVEPEEDKGMPTIILAGYWALISLFAVCATLWDKRAARRHRRRVPEATLLLLAVLGGGVCMYITMKAIRHKTLHKKFMIGLPLIILLHGALAAAAIWWIHVL